MFRKLSNIWCVFKHQQSPWRVTMSSSPYNTPKEVVQRLSNGHDFQSCVQVLVLAVLARYFHNYWSIFSVVCFSARLSRSNNSLNTARGKLSTARGEFEFSTARGGLTYRLRPTTLVGEPRINIRGTSSPIFCPTPELPPSFHRSPPLTTPSPSHSHRTLLK